MGNKMAMGRPVKKIYCAYCGEQYRARDSSVHQAGCRDRYGEVPYWEREGLVRGGSGGEVMGPVINKVIPAKEAAVRPGRKPVIKAVRLESEGQVVEKFFD